MGLIDLQTDLKSLRYGKDRPFAGSSNQPYVQRDIDVRDSEVGRTGGPDFLLRGGTLVPRRVANDVSRMTQMLFDLKTPNGPLFTAKQNILALTGVDQEAGFKDFQKSTGGSSIGDFFRNNLNITKDKVYTPLSTLGQSAGNAFGLHLYKQGLNPLTGPEKYIDYITEGSDKKSRLLNLTGGKLTTNDTNLYQYIGGPGSTNGIGRTQIRRYENTNLKEKNFLTYTELKDVGNRLEGDPNAIIDFRQEPNGSKVKTLDYSNPNNRIETRVRLGDPGRRGVNRTNYQTGLGEALDKINALSLYKGPYQLGSDKGNDFVKFRIGVIDNTNPSQKTFIHFRAFLDSFDDSYSAEWVGEKLMGRGEEFYRYNGFTRTINLSWTVAAQSKQELIPMYQKLNYLASSLAPSYSDVGYMGGNLVSLTLGGYLYEQPGIIRSMTLNVPQESPWEIAIPVSGEGSTSTGVESDKDVKELPHIIKVTNVQFIPIHSFVPQLQQNKYDGIEAGNGSKWLSAFGKERYIALSTGAPDGKGGGGNNNYGTEDGSPINEAKNYIELHPTDNKTVSTIKPQTIQFPTTKITAPILTNE